MTPRWCSPADMFVTWARLFVRTTNLNLTEPLCSFCPGFNLAEGPVVIALRSQLAPFSARRRSEIRASIAARLVWFVKVDIVILQCLEVHIGNLGRHRLLAVLTITIFTIIDNDVMPVTGSMWAMRFSGIWKPGRHVIPHGSSHPGVHVPPADEAGGIVTRTATHMRPAIRCAPELAVHQPIPLYPRKRTCAVQLPMSALCQ